MAGVSIGDIGLLQLNYQKMIVEALATGAKAFKDIEAHNWEGDKLDFRLHTARTTAMGFTEDGGARSVADKQDYATIQIGRRFYEAKLQISAGAMAAARTGKKSFVSVVNSEVKGVMRDALDFYNGFFFLDGTGEIGKIDGTTSGSTNIDITDVAHSLLWDGLVVEFRDAAAATTVHGTATLLNTEHDLTTGEVLINTVAALPSGLADGDTIHWKGSGTTSAYNRAIHGLAKLVDDTQNTFQNIAVGDASTDDTNKYVAYVNGNSGTNRPLTPLILRQTMAAVRQKCGNSAPKKGWTVYSNAWILKEFEEMYEGAYRLQGGSTQGYEGASFLSSLGKVNLTVDSDCPRHKLYMVDNSQIKHAVQKELGFDKDGLSSLFRNSHSNLNATAVMTCISQMYIKDRKSSARVDDIADSAVVSL